MNNLITLACLLAVLVYPAEGFTSKIYYQHTGESLEDIAHTSGNVVIVKPSETLELYREEYFGIAKNKDGQPMEEVFYKEHVTLYEVVEVLKSKTIKPGDRIKIWEKPVVSYELTKAYYERGIRRSFEFRRYEPQYPPKEGEDIIVFSDDMVPEKSVYKERGRESAAIREQTASILAKPYSGKKAARE